MSALPMVVAHRGASADAPENTLPAFELAWAQGADAIECDIWMTADEQLVCHHDPTTERSAGISRVITESRFAELQTLDVGKGARIPLLKDVLATVAYGRRIFIEIKDESHIMSRLAKVLDLSARGRVTLIAFDAGVLQKAGEVLPDVRRLWLSKLQPEQGLWYPSPSEMVAKLQETGMQGMDLQAGDGITREMVAELRDGGFELHVWTVDDVEAACRYAGIGVTSITTNRPAAVRDALLKWQEQ